MSLLRAEFMCPCSSVSKSPCAVEARKIVAFDLPKHSKMPCRNVSDRDVPLDPESSVRRAQTFASAKLWSGVSITIHDGVSQCAAPVFLRMLRDEVHTTCDDQKDFAQSIAPKSVEQ